MTSLPPLRLRPRRWNRIGVDVAPLPHRTAPPGFAVVWPRTPPRRTARHHEPKVTNRARLVKRRHGPPASHAPPSLPPRFAIPLPSPPLPSSSPAAAMAATLLRRALHLRRALPSPASSRALLPAASSRLLSVTASTQQNTAGTAIDLSNDESRRRLVNSLMYRSKQRGFLELDLVLGTWVEQHVRSMDEANIRSLLQILDLENPDLWKWLTGQEQAPETVNSNPVFAAIKSKVTDNLSKHSSPETRSAPGQPWVRGWDDKDKRGPDGPKYGNQ